MPVTAADPASFGRADLAQPRLLTEHLRLRGLRRADLDDVVELAGDLEVSRWTAAIPHPLLPDAALAWIDEAAIERRRGEAVTFAIERRADHRFIGGIILQIDGAVGDVGYWIGRPYWGLGYGTEALRCVLSHGFRKLGLDSIMALTLPNNAASLRIQRKAGMIDSGKTLASRCADRFPGIDVQVLCISRDEFAS